MHGSFFRTYILTAWAFLILTYTFAQPDTTSNRELVIRWVEEGFNNKNFGIVDSLIAEQFIVNGVPLSRNDLKNAMNVWVQAFPDLHVTIEQLIVERDRISFFYRASGTQQGEYYGIPPTSKNIQWFGADMLRIENNRIVEGWFVSDRFGIIRKLGGSISYKDE